VVLELLVVAVDIMAVVVEGLQQLQVQMVPVAVDQDILDQVYLQME
tara:strand:+ start:312 stop:449 length:138 start_codon:yes stop_codon:yes gene_type:complete